VLYCHGYTETFNSSSTQTVTEAYIQRNDHNILVVDWSQYSGGNYATEAFPNSYKVGDLVGRTLVGMERQGFKLDNFHIVGHSMGWSLIMKHHR
jgi:predicted alpha/beta-fold hydrolase